jgi:chemotaxis protein histidine kinase CheA
MPVNTDDLIKEVSAVLKTGLDKLLADYKDKYELYEETHQCVVKLQGLLGKAPSPSPHDDTRYDKLEKQIVQMKEEIALLKLTGGKPICDLVEDETQPVVKTESSLKSEPVVKTESTLKTEQHVVKAESTVKTEPKVVQPSDEKENITLIIEPVQEQEQEDDSEEEEESEEDESEEEQKEEEEEESEEEEEEKSEEEEQEELSDEEEEQPVIAAPTPAPAPTPEDEEEELFEIEIDDVSYCTNDEENGTIYALTADGDVGAKVGYLKDGEPFFE